MDAESFGSGTGEFGSNSVIAEDGKIISYEWRTTCDRKSRTIHFDSRYVLRESDSVLVEESEQLVLKMYTSQEVFDELQFAGFSGPRVVHKTGEMSWLRESACSLYECTVPGGRTDA